MHLCSLFMEISRPTTFTSTFYELQRTNWQLHLQRRQNSHIRSYPDRFKTYANFFSHSKYIVPTADRIFYPFNYVMHHLVTDPRENYPKKGVLLLFTFEYSIAIEILRSVGLRSVKTGHVLSGASTAVFKFPHQPPIIKWMLSSKLWIFQVKIRWSNIPCLYIQYYLV